MLSRRLIGRKPLSAADHRKLEDEGQVCLALEEGQQHLPIAPFPRRRKAPPSAQIRPVA
jgi:hypothetical protein